MRRLTGALLTALVAASAVGARQLRGVCGTTREKLAEQLHLHRVAEKQRREYRLSRAGRPATPSAAAKDIGEIAVMDDTDGVVARLNEFNLDGKTLTFTPATAAATAIRGEITDPREFL